MPDGASSQDKLFSHSQPGETLSQSKNHHLPLPHSSLSGLATRETCVVKEASDSLPSSSIHLPAPCSGSEQQARETLGSHPVSSESATCPCPQGKADQWRQRCDFWKFLMDSVTHSTLWVAPKY